jgi:hypothetical protein
LIPLFKVYILEAVLLVFNRLLFIYYTDMFLVIITWTPYGKIDQIQCSKATKPFDLFFTYDLMGNRIAKKKIDAAPLDEDMTYYVIDALGNFRIN